MNDIQCVIMAGGFGTRLGKLTEETPKSMIEINGKPFLQHQIELLKKNDITNILVCAGHLGYKIINYFGDGCRFGIYMSYNFDDSKGIKTALLLAKRRGLLKDIFLLLYGDSYLEINYQDVYEAFIDYRDKCDMLMTYCLNYSFVGPNVDLLEDNYIKYRIYNPIEWNESIFSDYGLSVLKRDVVGFTPFTTWEREISHLSSIRRLKGYHINKKFKEIGSIEGLNDLKNYLRVKK